MSNSTRMVANLETSHFRRSITSVCVIACLLPLLLAGCATGKPLPPADLSSGGWRIQQGQAVWRPTKGRPEIAGELLVASRRDGDAVVQFIKTPFPVVQAQRSGDTWQIQFGPEARAFRGKGTPPARFIWPQLAAVLAGRAALPKNWTLRSGAEGNWRFENRLTGETLEGFLQP